MTPALVRVCMITQLMSNAIWPSTAPHVEFTKPLHDVEVVEKESAKFECEVSRENIKVSTSAGPVCVRSGGFLHFSVFSHRSAGSKTEVKSGKGRSMKLLPKVADTPSLSTSPCLTMRLSMNVMPRPPSLLAC